MRPAIALVELSSIASGIAAGDAMVKRAPVAAVYAGTIHPGRYVVLVGGDTASVAEARQAALEEAGDVLVDELFLSDIHPGVADALTGARAKARGEAVGIVETATVAAVVLAADAGVKAADVDVLELRLGDDLGGKGYVVFGGAVAQVVAAVDGAVAVVDPQLLVRRVVISQLHDELRDNLAADPRFGARLRSAEGPER